MNNYFELYEVIGNTDAFVVYSTVDRKGVAHRLAKMGVERTFYGRECDIYVGIDEVTGEHSVSFGEMLHHFPVGSIHSKLCLDKRMRPCKTPPFEEQLAMMNRTVSPNLLKKWKQQCAEFRKKHPSKPDDFIKNEVSPASVWGISRRMQEEPDREFNARFEKWLSSQSVIHTHRKAVSKDRNRLLGEQMPLTAGLTSTHHIT